MKELLTKTKYKYLTIIKEVEPRITKSSRKIRMFLCQCDCGNIATISGWHLKSGHTGSCGCRKNIRHGFACTSVYNAWRGMKSRCLNKNNPRFDGYGGRGISVCDKWLKFENFHGDMGDKPSGKTLDRIDNNGNYEPSNCRWATPREQQNNMRSNHFMTFNGETLTVSQWTVKRGLKSGTLATRIRRGWSINKALNTPT